MSEIAALALSWLLTYLVHSSLLLGGVFLLERVGRIRSGALLSGLWRAAFFGTVLTATLQVLFATSPVHGRLAIPVLSAHAAVGPTLTRDQTPPVIRSQPRSVTGSRVDESVRLRNKHHTPGSASPAATYITRDSGPSMAAIVAAWSGRHWMWLVLSAWATLALVLLLRLGLDVLAARRVLDGRRRLREGSAREALESLCRSAGLHRIPQLSVCASLDGPVSLPNGEICLPPWTLEELAPEQFRAMLAHELAHCRRHDPWWQLAGSIVAAVLCIQPLNRVARAGLASSAELACDDWATRNTGDRRALAECLFECLSRTRTGRPAVLGSAMAVPGSALTRRVGRLVSGIQLFNGELSMKARIVIIGALVALALVAPGFLVTTSLAEDAPAAVPVSPASPASAVEAVRAQAVEAARQAAMARKQAAVMMREEAAAAHQQVEATRQMQIASLAAQAHGEAHGHISIRRNDHNIYISFEESGLSVKMQADGPFAFNTAENDLASLGAGDRLEMTVTQESTSRRIVFFNNGGKGIRHAYYIDGKSQPFDAGARRWLGGILPEILRETALNAKTRIARILKQGGPQAVVREIGRIRSGYARSVYIRDFSATGSLKKGVVDKLIVLAADIGSGYEREQALVGLFRSQDLWRSQLSALLKAGAGIDSGYEKSQLLKTVAGKMPLDKKNVSTYLGMTATIHSDYEKRMALKALLARPGLQKQALAEVMSMAAEHMHASYDLRTTLAMTAARVDGSEVAAKAYCKAAERIGSSYDKRMALSKLVRMAKLNKAGYLCVLDAAAGIDSDYDRTTLLVGVARSMPNNAALEAKYRAVAKSIVSDYDRRQAEEALQHRD